MNNNVKFLSIAVIAVAIIGAGLFFTKDEKPKDETVTIRMLDSGSTPDQWQIVKKLNGRDLLKEEGLKYEYIPTSQSGGTGQIQAQLANHVDYAGGGAWPARINAIASGGKIKTVVNSVAPITKKNPGNGLVVLENSSIHTAKDLIGKKIAINVLGAESDYVIRQYLKQNGMSIDQVELVVIADNNLEEQVLRSGQVDVAAWVTTGGVAYDMAMARGGLRELPGTTNYDIKGPNTPYGGGFRDDFIKEHPDIVKRFVISFEKVRRIIYDEYQKDPERVKKAYADALEEKGGNPKLSKYYEPTFSPDVPFITDKDVQWWLDIFESEGKLKPGQIKPSDVYTHEFNPYYQEYIQKKGSK